MNISRYIYLASFFLLLTAYNHADDSNKIVWPISDQQFFSCTQPLDLMQPTSSGRPESGTFGCVRNNGKRFHEGIDIKPSKRDKRGEPLDTVVACAPGTVVYVNRKAGNSNYGNYIAIEHPGLKPSVYSLYAHLKSISPNIKPGFFINAGTTLGTMGHTANHTIPKSQAHLHFEIGLMLSDNFETWFKDSKIGSPNHHGIWNGINLLGFDPLDFYTQVKEGKINTPLEYIQNQPTALRIRVLNKKIPSFLKRYPELIANVKKDDSHVGWDIDFTWFGLPTRFSPVMPNMLDSGMKNGNVTLLSYNPQLFKEKGDRGILILKNGKPPSFGTNLKRTLKLLFIY